MKKLFFLCTFLIGISTFSNSTTLSNLQDDLIIIINEDGVGHATDLSNLDCVEIVYLNGTDSQYYSFPPGC